MTSTPVRSFCSIAGFLALRSCRRSKRVGGSADWALATGEARRSTTGRTPRTRAALTIFLLGDRSGTEEVYPLGFRLEQARGFQSARGIADSRCRGVPGHPGC